MKEYKALRFLDRFQKIFETMGVDYPIMRRILEIKLTMDERRVPTIMGQNKNTKKKSKEKNSFISSLWVYLLIGLIMIPLILISENYIFSMSIVFGMLMFMIMTSLISDFSSVLLDLRDKNILMTKPVNSRTVNMAKGIHIFMYMFYLTLSLSAGSLITSLIRYGIFYFLLFLFEIVLMDLFIIVLTALLYTLILKYFDGEKLKDIINYVQIGLSLVITIGYQLVVRLFNFVDFNIVFEPRWWQFFIPPVWFAAPFQLLFHNDFNTLYFIFSLLAVFMPVMAIIAYVQLIPIFEKNLTKLNKNSEKQQRSKKIILKDLSRIVCRDKEEKTFYRFASAMMKKEREFKLKVYPSLGFSIIFPYIFLLNQLQMQDMHSISQGKGYLNLYFSALMIPTVLMMLKYSGNYKGAWIYKVIPIENAKPIFTGSIKAFIIHLILPIFLINCVIFIGIFGLRIVLDLVAIFLNFILLILITFSMLNRNLPFSLSFSDVTKENGRMFLLMFLGGFMALIHFVSTLIPYGILIYVVLLMAVNSVSWKKILNVSWEKVENSYSE
ncbi:MAG: hypothetical protein ACOWWR_05050 [Eubacteriales bacterium]